jgi:hypothetical protein
MFDRILLGVIREPQRDRIHLQRLGQFVHRGLQREHAHVLAGRAHVRAAGDVQHDDFVRRANVRRGVDRARRPRESFVVVGNVVPLADAFVNDRNEFAVRGRAEGHALFGGGPMSVREEELLARQPQLHRPLDLVRCERCGKDVRPRRSFAAERAADERRHDLDIFFRDAERFRHRGADREDVLRRVVQRELVAFPRRDERMRLHRIVMLVWRAIGLIDLDRGRGERGVGVANMNRRRLLRPFVRRLGAMFEKVGLRRQFVVCDAHEIRRVRGLLERLRDDDGDLLTNVVNVGVGEREEMRLGVVAGVGRRTAGLLATCWLRRRLIQPRHVEIRDHREHAGRFLRSGIVDRFDATGGNRGRDNDGVNESLHVVLGRVARGAGDLHARVDAIARLADHW